MLAESSIYVADEDDVETKPLIIEHRRTFRAYAWWSSWIYRLGQKYSVALDDGWANARWIMVIKLTTYDLRCWLGRSGFASIYALLVGCNYKKKQDVKHDLPNIHFIRHEPSPPWNDKPRFWSDFYDARAQSRSPGCVCEHYRKYRVFIVFTKIDGSLCHTAISDRGCQTSDGQMIGVREWCAFLLECGIWACAVNNI